jgi:hypothetical protein
MTEYANISSPSNCLLDRRRGSSTKRVKAAGTAAVTSGALEGRGGGSAIHCLVPLIYLTFLRYGPDVLPAACTVPVPVHVQG